MLRYLKRTYRPFRAASFRSVSLRPRVELLEERYLLSTINVHAGDDLQALLRAGTAGDTFVLDAGATFVGPIYLPKKSGNEWITIESSALDSLPGPGQRVGPEDAGLMPKIVSPGLAAPALLTDAGAHNFRIQGIEFMPATEDAFLYDLIDLGDGGYSQTALDQVPHDLVLDQCYIHAWPQQDLKRGIALNSASTSILDSYIAGFKSEGLDSQAIADWNGPGPFQINNNYLEAAGENVLFGGDLAKIPNLVPSNIEILGNDFSKPLSWKPDDPAYAGIPWTVKNLLELKSARHVLIEGNLLENNWTGSQDGFAILFTVRDQEGSMPWAAVEDITFQDNILAHVAGGFDILGTDTVPTARTQHIVIRNNLIEDMSSTWGSNGILLQVLDGVNDIVVDHNTAFPTKAILSADGLPSTGLVYQNNITTYGDYGIKGTNAAPGNDSLNKFLPGAVVANNVLVGQAQQAEFYPGGNSFPATLDDVGFVDLPNGNYRLTESSSYKNAGTDGADLGADIDAILAVPNTLTVPDTPTGLTATTVSSGEIDLTWGGVAGATSYEVERSPDGKGGWVQLAATSAGVTTFQDIKLSAGSTWFYRVRASNLAGDSDYSDPSSATTFLMGVVSSFLLAGFPSSLRAGSSAAFTVSAIDASWHVVPGYLGTIHFSSSDNQAVLPPDYTFGATDNGVHTFSVILKTAGTVSVTAADTATSSITGNQSAILIVAAPATVLRVAGFPSPATAGTAGSFTVTAIDPYGNTADGYRGTLQFSSSDSKAVLPGNYTFTAADNGVHTFSATFNTGGTWSLAAADTATKGITGTESAITVNTVNLTISRLVVAGIPSSLTAGTSVTFTVTATDANGKTVTGYRGTVHFNSSDSQVALPANFIFTAADNGVHVFSVTFKTAGTQSLTATDTTTTGAIRTQTNVVVYPADARTFLVTGFPSSAVHGLAYGFTVIARDAFGNTATGYRGTVHFTSSDHLALLPSNYTFTAGDNGVHTFSGTLQTAGTQFVSVTDLAMSLLTGSQVGIVVSPG
jgi:hypothetical protein